uniref:COX assembly mitochondrial protein n=1 Tax=Acrobeloides nanus TaxID=290746 RepID=A0A914D526_9BILA
MSEPKTERVELKKLRTDDLHKLKRGEIVVDENGKKYIVRKTLLPMHMGGGPANLGDPNDRTLRKIEADILIPDLMDTRIQKYDCHSQLADYVKCSNENGDIIGWFTCRGVLKVYKACKLEKFMDPKVRQEVTEDYLRQRSEYRQTGKTPNERNFEAYMKWKYGKPLNENANEQEPKT